MDTFGHNKTHGIPLFKTLLAITIPSNYIFYMIKYFLGFSPQINWNETEKKTENSVFPQQKKVFNTFLKKSVFPEKYTLITLS